MPIDQLFHTACPRGKGLDPVATGYQIKASSVGMTSEERSLLHGVCMHYGNAVYAGAPRTAVDAEREWFKPSGYRTVPPEVLSKFPVIWIYDDLTNGRFALTRVCYIGLNPPPDDRAGNYFAHALVFKPETLLAEAANPLSLGRVTGLFQNNNQEDTTQLEELSSFGNAVSQTADYEFLRAHAKHLPGLINALADASLSKTRPVVICLSDWRSSMAITEAVIALLPKSSRIRTTFCTYETERKRLQPPNPSRPTSVVGVHHLIVQYRAEGQSFGIRPDELQSDFAVFNFVENQFSPTGQASKYATFASQCVERNDLDRLWRHHALVEELGLGLDRAAWNSLVAAADVSLPTISQNDLAEAAKALAEVAGNAARANIALKRLLPPVIQQAKENNFTGLNQLAESIATIIQKSGAIDDLDETGRVDDLRQQARKALEVGWARTAAALFRAFGLARKKVLSAMLLEISESQSKFVMPKDAADAEPLLDLLVEGASLGRSLPERSALVLAAFRTFCSTPLSGSLWKLLCHEVSGCLADPWDESKTILANQLAECLTAKDSADGFVSLRLKWLPRGNLPEEKLVEEFENMVTACRLCTKPAESARQTVECARTIFAKSLDSAVILCGQMAEFAKDPGCQEIFREACIKELKSSQQPARLRQRLVDKGALTVVSWELLDDVAGKKQIGAEDIPKDWSDLLKGNPKLLERVCLDVAEKLIEPFGPNQENVPFRVAEQLIERFKPRFTAEGSRALFGAILTALPLEPMAKKWEAQFGSLGKEQVGPGYPRLCVIKFMGEVVEKSRQSDWSIEKFPMNQAWEVHLTQLSVPEKKEAVEWAVNLFRDTGIQSVAEMERLNVILAPAKLDSPQNLAQAILLLISQRDLVTMVVTAALVADCALKPGKSAGLWAETFTELTKKDLAKQSLHLLGEHLERRPRRNSDDYLERLRRLCEASGVPTPGKPPSKTNPVQVGATEEGKSRGNLLKSLLGGLLRHQEDPPRKGHSRH